MFCDGCGTAVQSGQAFCSSCGKRIVGSVALVQQSRGRVQGHLKLLGIFWLAFSGFNAVAGSFGLIAYSMFVHRMNVPPIVLPLIHGFIWFFLLKSAVGIAAGFGLMQREPWARTLALILAFVSLFTNIPFGTALGIYTLWVLLSHEAEQEYETLTAARAA